MTEVLVVVGLATLILPSAFVVAVALGWALRNRGAVLGSRFEAIVALLGGLSLGTFVLWSAGDLLIATALFSGTAAVAAVHRWRARERRQAGLIVAGFAGPWTLLWGWYVTALVAGRPLIPGESWVLFLGGLAVTGTGLAVALRGDARDRAGLSGPVASSSRGRGGGGRSLGTIAAAITEPTRVGPVRAPDLAALVAFVVTWLVVDVIPFPERWMGVVAGVVVGSVVATEAYVRAWPSRSRMAFEAFSWLGEGELAEVRRATGEGVPMARRGREAWLGRHPETPETAWIRAEMLISTGHLVEARELVGRMPAATPTERVTRASTLALLDWIAGLDPDLSGLEAAVAEVQPADSEERLRADVGLATARVRLLAAERGVGGDDVLAPLLEVRGRLGRRADGQLGRALRRRILPVAIGFGIVIGLGMLALGW